VKAPEYPTELEGVLCTQVYGEGALPYVVVLEVEESGVTVFAGELHVCDVVKTLKFRLKEIGRDEVLESETRDRQVLRVWILWIVASIRAHNLSK